MIAPGNVLDHQDIWIEDDRIQAVVPRDEDQGEADSIIDGTHKLYLAGLIDSHLHTGQQLLRTHVLDAKPIVWTRVMLPFESHMTPDIMELSAQVAALEMITGGTTGFVESGSYCMEAAGNVYLKSGLRGALTYSTMDDPNLPESIRMSADTAIAHTDALFAQFQRRGNLQVYYGLRALNNCSEALIELAIRRAHDRGTTLQAHMNEYPAEVQGIVDRTGGLRPYVWLAKMGGLNERFLGAHSIFLSDEEMTLIAKNHVTISHSPFSNAGKGVPNTPALFAQGVHVGLGTDGAGHGGLSLWNEMKIFRSVMSLHYGSTQKRPKIMPAAAILSMVQEGGAAALGMSGRLGRVAPGYKADLIGIDLDTPHLWAGDNLTNLLLECVNAGDVADTMVAGKWLMRNREVLTLDVERIKARIDKLYPRLWQAK